MYVRTFSHYQSATNASITASTWAEVEALRDANPTNEDYKYWVDVYKLEEVT